LNSIYNYKILLFLKNTTTKCGNKRKESSFLTKGIDRDFYAIIIEYLHIIIRKELMSNLKKTTVFIIMTLFFISGCTQIVTAPIGIASSIASGAIDVAGSAIGAVTGGSSKK